MPSFPFLQTQKISSPSNPCRVRPAAPAGQRRESIAACRGEVSRLNQSRLVHQYRNHLIRNNQVLKPMKRCLAPSPAGPLIARFGCPDRRKAPPVRPRREAAGKYLIYTALSSMTAPNLSSESMIRPVSPLLQGALPSPLLPFPMRGRVRVGVAYRRRVVPAPRTD